MSEAAPATAPADPGQGLETPAPEAAAPQGVVPEVPATEVQPADPAATTQPDGGQGLIAPYLEGVDDATRDIVAEKLDAFRRDQDAQVTKRFEDLNRFQSYVPEGQGPDYLDLPVALYENLLEDPKGTVEWIFEQFNGKGLDLRTQLLEAASATPAEQVPAEPQADGPLTREEVAAEFQRLQQEEQARAAAEQQTQQNRELAQSWFDEATQKHGLSVDEGDVALRQAILTHAAQLLPQLRHLGAEAGKAAIGTAVEAFANKYGSKVPAPAGDPATEPTIASGGTPPAPAEPDFTDPVQRRKWMVAQAQALTASE